MITSRDETVRLLLFIISNTAVRLTSLKLNYLCNVDRFDQEKNHQNFKRIFLIQSPGRI